MSMQVTAITHKRKPVFVSIISQVTPSESSVIKKVAYEPMFLVASARPARRSRASSAVVDARAADQPAQGDLPAIRARHAAHRSLARRCTARRRCSADCGKIVIAVSEDIDPTNADAVFWSLAYRANPIEDVQIVPLSLRRPRPEVRPRAERFDAADRRHAEGRRCRRWRCRRANSWSARAAIWEELGLPRAHAAAAVARLFARRLGRRPGTPMPSARSTGDWEAERQGDLRAPPRRPDAGNAGARRGGEEEMEVGRARLAER